MAQWKRIRLRIWGLQVRSLLCSSFLELFYLNFYPVVYLIVFLSSFSLNGNVAQSVERKSHNLKVVSSILTVPTFFCFFYLSSLSSLLLSPLYFPFIPFSSPTFLSLFFSPFLPKFPPHFHFPFITLIPIFIPYLRTRAYGAMETHQTSDLRIAGSIPAMLVFFRTFLPEFLSCRVPYRLSILFFFERERSSVGRA